MPDDHVAGILDQLNERALALLRHIPRDLPDEFNRLEQRCKDLIYGCIKELERLSGPTMRKPAYREERLRALRRVVRDLDTLENVGIAALSRAKHDEDRVLNRLISDLRREIRYPLVAPTVSPFSRSYFHIYPELGVLNVPLMENRFLLHLPDLLHELAHPLLSTIKEPQIEPFRRALALVSARVDAHFRQELLRAQRTHLPGATRHYMELWRYCWLRSWVEELLCDLFATFTTGAAYGWAHLHLYAKTGADPYAVAKYGFHEHPADGARMSQILTALKLIGQSEKAERIQARWRELCLVSNLSPDQDYRLCYPTDLLEYAARQALAAMSEMGTRVAVDGDDGPIIGLLNRAWEQFWLDPKGFSAWEADQVSVMFSNGRTGT